MSCWTLRWYGRAPTNQNLPQTTHWTLCCLLQSFCEVSPSRLLWYIVFLSYTLIFPGTLIITFILSVFNRGQRVWRGRLGCPWLPSTGVGSVKQSRLRRHRRLPRVASPWCYTLSWWIHLLKSVWATFVQLHRPLHWNSMARVVHLEWLFWAWHSSPPCQTNI